jgi:hypothetical protein
MGTATPAARLLQARLVAGDQRAVQRVRSALARNHGSPKHAAGELGVKPITLRRWLRLPACADIQTRGVGGRISQAEKDQKST